MTSTIGCLRLRHFPRRWLKKAGAKYRLICRYTSTSYGYKIYWKTMGCHDLKVYPASVLVGIKCPRLVTWKGHRKITVD